MSINNHTITIQATDSKDQRSEETITITIIKNDFTFGEIAPAQNAQIYQGDQIIFSCNPKFVSEETIDEQKIVWTSDKDGEIGKGKTFNTTNLSVNNHKITISYTAENTYTYELQLDILSNEMNFGAVTPNNNLEIIEAETINFSCNPTFPNQNITIDEQKIIWTSDKDGEIGKGKTLNKTNLSANQHKITISYQDYKTFYYEVNVKVNQNTVTLTLEQLQNKYYRGYNINFKCTATNLNNASFNESKVVWTSDKDGTIGSGFNFYKSDLSVNTHVITVTAENDFGRQDEKSFSFTITNDKANFEMLMQRMTGYFSSQAHADTTTNQYIVDVRLHMAQIWKDRNVGENIYWLYVEQAYADDQANPYRQRIYKMVLAQDGTIYDEIYSITNPTIYKQGYLNPAIFDNLTTSGIVIKENCGLKFTLNQQNIFEASTEGNSCLATIPYLPQVKYITTQTKLAETYMTSWDRGYSSTGAWLMGPDWPYIFDKLENYTFTPSKKK